MRTARCLVMLLLLSGTAAFNGAASPMPVFAQPKAASDNEFSLAVAEHLIVAFRRALIAENQSRIVALFDPNLPAMDEVASQIESLFARYDSLRVYARMTQTATEDARGIAMVEFTLEATPPNGDYLPVRHSAELRFTFARIGKEWKIVKIEPRNYFAQF